MSKNSKRFSVLVVAAIGLFSASSAQACGFAYCGQPAAVYWHPHSYVVEPLPAMTELVPNVYMLDRHRWYRNYPYVYCGSWCSANTGYHYRYGGTAPVRRGLAAGPGGNEPRVINADAVVTIIGADRMDIRLHRKGGRANWR